MQRKEHSFDERGYTPSVLLPYCYTLFKEASVSGIPVMHPLWLEFPDDKETFNSGDAPSILVQGIYQEVFHMFIFIVRHIICH